MNKVRGGSEAIRGLRDFHTKSEEFWPALQMLDVQICSNTRVVQMFKYIQIPGWWYPGASWTHIPRNSLQQVNFINTLKTGLSKEYVNTIGVSEIAKISAYLRSVEPDCVSSVSLYFHYHDDLKWGQLGFWRANRRSKEGKSSDVKIKQQF